MTRDRGLELRGDADATAFFDRMSHHMPRAFIAVMSRLPAEPRCRLCRAPYGGIGGRIMRRVGFGPSRKNPNLCSTCFERAPMGGAEMEIGVLFAEGWEDEMLRDASELLEAVGFADDPWLPLGIGLDIGTAYVGNVGEGEVKDFTALGDVVNTAARLQSAARAGQIVISERLCARLSGGLGDAKAMSMTLKGKAEAEPVRVLG
jgi:hypothetical protein